MPTQGRLLLACLLTSLVLSSSALAQERIECTRSAGSRDEAQALFRAGVAATNQERWSDAIGSLRRAYELSCHPSALFNLGASLRALGRHREARDVLSQLLADHPDLAANVSSIARSFLAEERARVAVLELLDIAPDVRPEMSFDGRPIADDGSRPVRLETDAGTHSLQLRIPEHQPFLWNGELTDGQVERVAVLFEPIEVIEAEGFEWGWVVLGVAAAAVVAGGITAAVLLQDDAQLRPYAPGRFIELGAN